MQLDYLPHRATGYFSPLICDYLDDEEQLRSLYTAAPELTNFEGQIRAKTTHFNAEKRNALVKALTVQYNGLAQKEAAAANISRLLQPNCFTVVTGHQLNIFTGPIFFLYKIVTTIKLAQELKERYPDQEFVPVYWMATEDHDFAEINHFNLNGKVFQWNPDQPVGGPVGRMGTEGLEDVFKAFSLELGSSKNAEELKRLFSKAYLEQGNLARATRYLVNELFGEHGLVILDGDSAELKQQFVPFIERDLENHISSEKVESAAKRLQDISSSYGVQVNPRQVNYFYFTEQGLRERIIETESGYKINNTNQHFSKAELFAELKEHPERFSPNVITRPLYQEVVLPNLCYIGGGGELAYWLELKSFFDTVKVPFPLLMLRNSVLLVSEKVRGKMARMNLSVADMFLKQNSLINKKIREISNIDIDFSPQKAYLQEQFQNLYALAEETDASFKGAVAAQEKKQLKGLEHLEKRLLKAQKRKLQDQVARVAELQNQLFPNRSLQERTLNFSEPFMELGEDLIPMLLEHLEPFRKEFLIITHA